MVDYRDISDSMRKAIAHVKSGATKPIVEKKKGPTVAELYMKSMNKIDESVQESFKRGDMIHVPGGNNTRHPAVHLGKKAVYLDDDGAVDYVPHEVLSKSEKMKKVSSHHKSLANKYLENMKEEVEELEELSKDTLQNYSNKAKAHPAFEKKPGPTPKAKKAVQNKRIAGLEMAAKKLDAIRNKEYAAKQKERVGYQDDLHAHFHKEAPGILKRHGYSKVTDHENRSTWVRPHETGHVTTVTLAKKREPNGFHVATHDFGSSINSSSRHRTHNSSSMDKETHEKAKREMMPEFEAAVIKHHSDDWHWHHHMNEETLTEEEINYISSIVESEEEVSEEENK